MLARIVYIHHDCFFLLTDATALLFDYPSPPYLPAAAATVAASVMAGRRLAVFASHSHDDHFTPDIVRATAPADTMRLIVADDVADLYGDVLPPDTVAMKPGDMRVVEGMRVEALESNDQGVAYRIELDGLSIYFGGDLALWDWPGGSPAATRAVGMSWRRTLRRLKARPVDVAFSNMDPRLPESLSGAPDFVKTVAPRIFVPMHLDGHVEYLERHADRLAGPKTTVFRYTAPGDVLDVGPETAAASEA